MEVEEEDDNFLQVEGIFVKKDFDHLILNEQEISLYCNLKPTKMKQKQYIPFSYDIQVANYLFQHNFA